MSVISPAFAEPRPAYLDPSVPIDARVKDLIGSTLR